MRPGPILDSYAYIGRSEFIERRTCATYCYFDKSRQRERARGRAEKHNRHVTNDALLLSLADVHDKHHLTGSLRNAKVGRTDVDRHGGVEWSGLVGEPNAFGRNFGDFSNLAFRAADFHGTGNDLPVNHLVTCRRLAFPSRSYWHFFFDCALNCNSNCSRFNFFHADVCGQAVWLDLEGDHANARFDVRQICRHAKLASSQRLQCLTRTLEINSGRRRILLGHNQVRLSRVDELDRDVVQGNLTDW